MSPHPSLYQNTPTGSFYQRSSSNSVPTLNPDAPLERRRKPAPEGPQAGVSDRKGKQKAIADAQSPGTTHETGKDPLEIAYGPTVGTHPHITKDDFKVDTDSGLHKPHQESARGSGRDRHVHHEESSQATGEGAAGEGGQEGGDRGSDQHSGQQYGLDGEDEFRNVWGR